MLKKVLYLSFIIAGILAAAIYSISGLKIVLFTEIPWVLGAAAYAGLVMGIIRGGTKRKTPSVSDNGKKERHTIDSYLEHFGTAGGILLLAYSGFMARARQGFFFLNLHFVGVFIVAFFGFYFLGDFFIRRKYKDLLPSYEDIMEGTVKKYLLRMSWQDTGKYLSSQKSAVLGFMFLGTGLIITGAAKTGAFFYQVPPVFSKVFTFLHDSNAVLLVLMFLMHMMIITFIKEHRNLIPSWFTGTVSVDEITLENNMDVPEIVAGNLDVRERRGWGDE